IPVSLLRESCTPDAERLTRLLGRAPQTAEPWLPVTTVGPIIVMAHHSSQAGDLWGVPLPFTFRVLISADQYMRTRQDLVQRFLASPLPKENPFEHARFPSFNVLGLEDTFQWLLQNYPYDPTEVTKLTGFYEAAKEKTDRLTA